MGNGMMEWWNVGILDLENWGNGGLGKFVTIPLQ